MTANTGGNVQAEIFAMKGKISLGIEAFKYKYNVQMTGENVKNKQENTIRPTQLFKYVFKEQLKNKLLRNIIQP